MPFRSEFMLSAAKMSAKMCQEITAAYLPERGGGGERLLEVVIYSPLRQLRRWVLTCFCVPFTPSPPHRRRYSSSTDDDDFDYGGGGALAATYIGYQYLYYDSRNRGFDESMHLMIRLWS